MLEISIGLLGDKTDNYLPHESAEETMRKMLASFEFKFVYEWVPTQKISLALLKKYDGFWVCSGPFVDEQNLLLAIQYARVNKKPTIGTCSGFKYMIIEYAKNVFNVANAFEYIGRNEFCSTAYKDISIKLKKECSLLQVYNTNTITEVSHCNYEIAPTFSKKLSTIFEFCGKEKETSRIVLIRLKDHPFYVASLFLPQLKSNNKLLVSWLKTCCKTELAATKF